MFLNYIHSFRALAIFLIVAGHSIDAFVWPTGSELEKIFRILISNGSTLFVFIAGYLFQHLSPKYDTRKYHLTKLKNVLLPYFLISIPAIYIFIFILQRETVWQGFYDNPEWLQIVLFYLTGMHLAPLWFIPMISLFYLVAPLLIKADKAKFIYYFLPLFLLLSCFIGRGLPHISFIHFFSLYLLGMFCSHYKDKLNPILADNKTLLLLIITALTLAFAEFQFMESTMSFMNFLQKTSLSLFFLGLFIRFNTQLESRLISTIADTSFGVFFIHSYILTAGKLIYQHINGALPQGHIIFYFLVAISTLLLCVLIIVMIRKIFGRYSRYLVGS